MEDEGNGSICPIRTQTERRKTIIVLQLLLYCLLFTAMVKIAVIGGAVNKKRFIHSFRCVYMLKDYPPFQANDFEYLRGRIQILLPENDIFKKEDQNRFAQLFRKLDAEIRTVPGGHVGFIVQSERYLDLMEAFLRKIF